MHSTRILLTFLITSLIGCGEKEQTASTEDQNNTHNKESEKHEADSTQSIDKPEVIIPADTAQTKLAYYLGGMSTGDSMSSIYSNTAWRSYQQDIDKQWQNLETNRLNALKSWGDSTLSDYLNDTLPLFYPFSGPDFLHAHSFYPEASEYYMIALEKVYDLPDIDAFNESQHATFLRSMRKSLRDILSKSYFITTHMMEDLTAEKADGVLPLFYAFLARTGHEIIDVYPIEVDNLGRIYKHDSLSYDKNQAVQFKFRAVGDDKIKTLSYFSRSISDRDLDKVHPNFKTFLEQRIPESNAFVKAASYLMHYEGFGVVRDGILRTADCVFQDDTGIPLRYLDQAQWTIHLLGDYTRPIKNFTDRMYQPDLNALYDNTKKTQKLDELPFSLGYHIVGDKIQNHQIFVRQ